MGTLGTHNSVSFIVRKKSRSSFNIAGRFV